VIKSRLRPCHLKVNEKGIREESREGGGNVWTWYYYELEPNARLNRGRLPAIEFQSGKIVYIWIPGQETLLNIWKSVGEWLWAACSCATADCIGDGANDSAEITTRGDRPAPILQIHSIQHAAASTPSHGFTGRSVNFFTIWVTVFASCEQVRVKNFPVLQSGWFKA